MTVLPVIERVLPVDRRRRVAVRLVAVAVPAAFWLWVCHVRDLPVALDVGGLVAFAVLAVAVEVA